MKEKIGSTADCNVIDRFRLGDGVFHLSSSVILTKRMHSCR